MKALRSRSRLFTFIFPSRAVIKKTVISCGCGGNGVDAVTG